MIAQLTGNRFRYVRARLEVTHVSSGPINSWQVGDDLFCHVRHETNITGISGVTWKARES